MGLRQLAVCTYISDVYNEIEKLLEQKVECIEEERFEEIKAIEENILNQEMKIMNKAYQHEDTQDILEDAKIIWNGRQKRKDEYGSIINDSYQPQLWN